MGQPKRDTTKPSPMRLVLVLLLAIFTVEFGIMALLLGRSHAALTHWVVAAIDSTVLIALLFPVLFFVVFRPLSRQVKEHEQARKELERTGSGIAREDLLRLFRPLVQLDAGLARRHGGVGLGLALTRRLAELHGGAIEVASEPGKGSTFTLRLPYQDVEK